MTALSTPLGLREQLIASHDTPLSGGPTVLDAPTWPWSSDRAEPKRLLDAVIVSDIHLGADNCEAKPLANLLEAILAGDIATRSLIINGDVFDSIDFRRLRKTHWKILSLIRHLSDKIEVVWIAGNHDGSADIISHLLGVDVVNEYLLVSGGRKMLILHGHQFDDFIDDHPVLTWLADGIYWALQQIDRTHYVARLAKRRSKIFVHAVEKIERGALALAKQRGCQAVICGHTHHSAARESGPVHYYNSGCWTERPSAYLTVCNGVVELILDRDAKEEAAVAEPAVATAQAG